MCNPVSYKDNFKQMDEYQKIAEWDIFIGTFMYIAVNITLLYTNFGLIIPVNN